MKFLDETVHELKATTETVALLNYWIDENRKLREILEFYADKENYNDLMMCRHVHCPIHEDKGERAREALDKI